MVLETKSSIKNHLVRRLNENDIEIYYQGWLNRHLLFDGHNHASAIADEPKSREYVHDILKSDAIVFGRFIEDNLVACVSVMPWRGLPYYTFYDFFSIKGFEVKFYENADSLFKSVFEFFEPNGRFTFYMMTKLRSFQRHEIINDNKMTRIVNSIPSFSRYDIYLEELVAPGDKSNFYVHNELLKNQKWQCTTIIRKGCLKMQYRLPLFQKQISELK